MAKCFFFFVWDPMDVAWVVQDHLGRRVYWTRNYIDACEFVFTINSGGKAV